MAKTEGTYIRVAHKNVFGYISTNSWLIFMIQRPTIREECAWVRSNTWQDERPVVTGLDQFFPVFWFFDTQLASEKIQNFCNCLVFCSCVQFDFGLFSSLANWELLSMPHWFLPDSGHSCGIQWNPEESNLAETPAKMTFRGTQVPAEWCHSWLVTGMVPGMDKKECNQNAITGIDITN